MIDPIAVENTLESFLSYPSPQPDLAAVKQFVATVVRPRVEGAGFDRIAVDGGGNLVATRLGARPDLPPLIWYTYGATYPAAGMADPYPARRILEEGDLLLRGRGAAEQRTGLAAAVEALRSLAGLERPERGITLVTCVAGEMGSHLVAESLARQGLLQGAGAVLAIATGGEVGLGNLGRVDIEVEVRGIPCHSSSPGRGVNAVDGAVEFCLRLRGIGPLPSDPDLGEATIAITGISSEPRAAHTIPSRCVVTIDRRLLPGESPEETTAAVRACARGIAPQEVSVRSGHFNLPGKLAPDHPLPRLAVEAAGRAGLAAPFFYRRAALDAGYLMSIGTPAIMWGPGNPALAHTDEERVKVADVVRGAEAYRALSLLACWERPVW